MINYDLLQLNKTEILVYAFDTSDSFALLIGANLQGKDIPVLAELEKYLLGHIDPREESGGVFNVYKCCEQTKNIVLSMGHVFDYQKCVQNDLPEDIEFYRDGKLWFDTVYFEKEAYLEDAATDADRGYFKSLNLTSTVDIVCDKSHYVGFSIDGDNVCIRYSLAVENAFPYDVQVRFQAMFTKDFESGLIGNECLQTSVYDIPASSTVEIDAVFVGRFGGTHSKPTGDLPLITVIFQC